MFLKEGLFQALFSSAPSSDLAGENKGGWFYLWRDINLHGLDADILGVRHLVNICVAELEVEMSMEDERWCEGLHVVRLDGWEGTRVGTRVARDPISCIGPTRSAVRRVTGDFRGVCLLVVTRVLLCLGCATVGHSLCPALTPTVGARNIRTADPKNIQAFLANKFNDFGTYHLNIWGQR